MKIILIIFSSIFMSMSSIVLQKDGFQQKIEKAFVESIESNSNEPLEKAATTLAFAFEEKDTISTRYWLSYARYHQALLAGEINKDKKQAEQFIDRAISLLKPLKNDSESLALLSIQIGYSIRFKSYFAMVGLGQDSRAFAETALALDPTNLRAYYSLAINDFYTPKVFGGGREVEFYLKKALGLSQNENVEDQPTWGKDSVYELLIKQYKKEEKDSLAQKYLTQALALYPNNQQLKALFKEL